MTASIYFYIQDDSLREKLAGYLEGEKYIPSFHKAAGPAEAAEPEAPPAPAEAAAPAEGAEAAGPKEGSGGKGAIEDLAHAIIVAKPDIVVMDYIEEDALSVKVMQSVTDALPHTSFVFMDSGAKAGREAIILAFNEGARGFLAPDVTKTIFLNSLTRAYSGPSRIRTGEDSHTLEQELQNQGQKLSKMTVRLSSARKLVSYLLTTPVNSQPRKILVLSDSGYQREILKKLLEDYNFVVITAKTIAEAVPMTLKEKPRIIVSDYNLEDGKTGVDFCKELKYTQKYIPCYFVVCTANAEILPQVMAPGNGVDDCLLKPSTENTTAEFINSIALGLIL
jgi:CheY-like chemotaxis protein